MPRLPSVDEVTRLPVQVGRGVADYRDGEYRETDHRGGEVLGQNIRSIGQQIAQDADQELARLDELRVEEAVIKLREKDTELTLGEKGYVSVKGDAALSKPIVDQFGTQYKQAADEIGTGLTARQRARFDIAATRGRQQFQANVLRHTLGEADKRDDEVYKANIFSIQDKASKFAASGISTDGVFGELDSTLARRLRRDGIDPATPDGSKIAGAIRLQEHGKVHGAIVEAFIQGDRFTEATAYLAANEKNLTADQYKAANSRLKPLNDIAVGGGFGTQAIELLKGGATQAQALSHILKSSEGKPAQQQAAMQRFEIERNAWRADQDNIQGAYFLKYSGNPTLASYRQLDTEIRKDPNLSPQERNQAVEHLAALRDRDDSRRRAAAAEGRSGGSGKDVRDVQEIVKVYNLVAQDGFAAKTPEQVVALGVANGLDGSGLKALLAQREHQRTAARNVKFDSVLLNDAATQIAPKDKTKQLAFKALAAKALDDWQVENPGKVPTEAQKQNFLHTGAVKYKDFSTVFNTEEFAVDVGDPLRAVPLEFYNEQLSAAKKAGKKEPGEKEILQAYGQEQQQRAGRVAVISSGVPLSIYDKIQAQAKAKGRTLTPEQVANIYKNAQVR